MSTRLYVKGNDGKMYQVSPAPDGGQSKETAHAARAMLEEVLSAIGSFRLVDSTGATIIAGDFKAAFRGRTRRECQENGFRDLYGLDFGYVWASERHAPPAPDNRTTREIALGPLAKVNNSSSLIRRCSMKRL